MFVIFLQILKPADTSKIFGEFATPVGAITTNLEYWSNSVPLWLKLSLFKNVLVFSTAHQHLRTYQWLKQCVAQSRAGIARAISHSLATH